MWLWEGDSCVGNGWTDINNTEKKYIFISLCRIKSIQIDARWSLAKFKMVVAMWVKKEDHSVNQVGGNSQSRRHETHETLSSLQDPDRGVQAASSRSDTELLDSGARQRFAGLLCNTHSSLLHFSRREMFETSRSAEVAKSKSLSLKSQLKSPFKFLGKTYCGGCKVRADSAQPHRT